MLQSTKENCPTQFCRQSHYSVHKWIVHCWLLFWSDVWRTEVKWVNKKN